MTRLSRIESHVSLVCTMYTSQISGRQRDWPVVRYVQFESKALMLASKPVDTFCDAEMEPQESPSLTV